MKNSILALTKNFVNLIYPLRCAVCQCDLDPMDKAGVCAPCFGGIKINPGPHCQKCGRTFTGSVTICPECRKHKHYFDCARSVCMHEGVVKELIHAFKYKGRLSLSGILSGILINYLKRNTYLIDNIDLISYVPMHQKRLRTRSFNQSRVLAHAIAEEFGIPLSDSLYKTKHTKQQNELSREGRLVNLGDAFDIKDALSAGSGLNHGPNILLIDDVMATGATLDECSKVLMKKGARVVRCLTLSRGM